MVAQPIADAPAATQRNGLAERGEPGPSEWIAAALEASLKARAPALHASTPLVAQLAHRVGRELGLDPQSQGLLEVSVRVRDIGMVALPDSVVLRTDLLTPADWELVHRHPILGAELLESLAPVAAAALIVRAHHERWDGDGYPDGRRGDAIPPLSRVIAICDAFVAMASDRPYRRGIGTEAALEHIRLERGAQFDPSIADTFLATVAVAGGAVVRGAEENDGASSHPAHRRPTSRANLDLASAIADFDVVPAFAPACEQALAASDANSTLRSDMIAAIESDARLTVAVLRKARTGAGQRRITNVAEAVATLSPGGVQAAIRALPHAGSPRQTTPLEALLHRSHTHAQAATVAAIESDTGLTIAVLRKAQAVASRRRIGNVGDAVAALSPSQIQDAIRDLPRAGFPWRTTPLEVLLHRSRIHAQAVTRAADRIAREVKLEQRDDLLVAALLHDIGKLVLTRIRTDYPTAIDVRSATPENRIRQEQEDLSLDHASLGSLLLRRWGLPERLAGTVAAHHTSDAPNEIATFVRLADTIAHHAQGDAVDRAIGLRLAHACNLSTKALRDVMFDLPHSGGSQRRRAERSPLSNRQSEVLRLLGQGKLYDQIAAELDLAVSTVRSHLHGIYEKLAVPDRAQAVLYATEMGWI